MTTLLSLLVGSNQSTTEGNPYLALESTDKYVQTQLMIMYSFKLLQLLPSNTLMQLSQVATSTATT